MAKYKPELSLEELLKIESYMKFVKNTARPQYQGKKPTWPTLIINFHTIGINSHILIRALPIVFWDFQHVKNKQIENKQ